MTSAALALSRATLRTIKKNLFWAFAYTIILIPHCDAFATHPVLTRECAHLRCRGHGTLFGDDSEQLVATAAVWAVRRVRMGRDGFERGMAVLLCQAIGGLQARRWERYYDEQL